MVLGPIVARTLLLVCLATALAGSADAQLPNNIRKDVCVLELAGMDKVRADTGQVFRTIGDRALRFDLYTPPKVEKGGGSKEGGASLLPVVVFVNGVGAIGAPLREWGIYRSWAQLVAVSGMAAVTHDSRPGAAGEDLRALIDHLRKNAAKLGIDPENIAIWACSANLRPGSAYALDPANTWVRCAVFYYGAVDTAHVRPDLPVLVARAGLDSQFTNGSMTSFIARSLAQNGSVTVLNLPNARHAFDLFDPIETSRDAVRTTLTFLRTNLRPEVQEARRVRTDQTHAIRLHAARNWEGTVVAALGWISKENHNGQPYQLLADAAYQLKDFRKAGEHYERSGRLGWMPALTWYNAGCSWALAGERDRALSNLERSLATGFFPNRQSVLEDPDLASLRGDPRFQKIVAAP